MARLMRGGGCPAELLKEPLPLYSEDLQIAVLWNAKAGCTFAIKWLYFQEGLLDEAEAYAPWPHQYRQQVFCRRPGHAHGVRRIPELGPRAIKFVRNPFDRAVGGYLSYCQQAFGQTSSQHTRMLKSIGRYLGRSIGNGQLFTFREFVSYLGSLDLDHADIHVRRQLHRCEREGSLSELSIVRVEQAREVIPRLEEGLGLRPSDLDVLQRSGHHTRRVAGSDFVGDHAFGRIIGVPVPASRSFYDAGLADEIGRLYQGDIEAYGYSRP